MIKSDETVDSKIMVSVYCLAYNHEKYIRHTLNGFVSQKTNFRYEVFVHDDASTDNTASIIQEYADKYPDIIKPIFQTENQHSQKIPIIATHILPKMSGKYIAACEGTIFGMMKISCKNNMMPWKHTQNAVFPHIKFSVVMKMELLTAE